MISCNPVMKGGETSVMLVHKMTLASAWEAEFVTSVLFDLIHKCAQLKQVGDATTIPEH